MGRLAQDEENGCPESLQYQAERPRSPVFGRKRVRPRCAGGVTSFLEEKGVGCDVEVAKVPIACGAILFDLKCVSVTIRSDARKSYEAGFGAYRNNFQEGNFGAGTGATIGKSKAMNSP